MKHIKFFEKFFAPSLEIKNKIDNIVQRLLDKHRGGRPFFDALDSEIKIAINNDLILSLLKGSENDYVVSSGEFGDIIYKLWKDGKFKCRGVVIFNGKMRTQNIGVFNWYPNNFKLDNKKFIYVDDSIFTGSTSRKIDDFLRQRGSKIKEIYVIYDGSKGKSNKIKSFFKYYK
jgi:hypoxanthine-guanine phosphoribosyltransferase